MKARLGQTVVYRSHVDNGPGNDVLSPAVVLRTRETTIGAVAEQRWSPATWQVTATLDGHEVVPRPPGLLAELPDDEAVDLLVHGLARDYRVYGVRQGDARGGVDIPGGRAMTSRRSPDTGLCGLDAGVNAA